MSRADSPLRDRMVFLVGARRSGTNWLEHLLTLHPALVAVPGETHLFSHGIATLAERVQHGLASSAKTGTVYVDRETFLDATRDWCDAVLNPFLTRSPVGTLLLERTPLHAQHLDLIAAIYPDASVVHLVRDGTAVALSLLAQEWGPHTIDGAAREWAETVRAVHRADVPRLREVRHEQVAADPVSGVRDLWQWLGLDVSEQLEEAVAREAGKPVNTTEGKPGTRPKHQRLSGSDTAAIAAEAGAELQRLGYPLPEPRRRTARDSFGAARQRMRKSAPQTRAAPQRGGSLWYEESQRLVDQLLTAGQLRDAALLRHITAEDLQVEVDGSSSAAEKARHALMTLLEAAADGVRADAAVHPGNPTFTVVVRNGDLVLIIEPGDSVIRRVVGYRLGGHPAA